MTTVTRVANLSTFPIEVSIVDEKGHTTEIFVQPKARPRLPAGYTLTAQCAQEFQGVLVQLVDTGTGTVGTELPQLSNARLEVIKEGV